MLRRGIPAAENLAAASPLSPHRRQPQSRSLVRRDRSRPPSPPLGCFQPHSRIAAQPPDLVRRGPTPQPRRPGPDQRRGAGVAGCARRSGGDLAARRRGPRARPRLARGPRQLPRLRAPRAREGGGGAGAPRWARPRGRGGTEKGRSALGRPPGGRLPPSSHFLSCAAGQLWGRSPGRQSVRAAPHRRACARSPLARRGGLAPPLTGTWDFPRARPPRVAREQRVGWTPGVARAPALPFAGRAGEASPTRRASLPGFTNKRPRRASTEKKPLASTVYSCKSAALFS